MDSLPAEPPGKPKESSKAALKNCAERATSTPCAASVTGAWAGSRASGDGRAPAQGLFSRQALVGHVPCGGGQGVLEAACIPVKNRCLLVVYFRFSRQGLSKRSSCSTRSSRRDSVRQASFMTRYG